MTRKHDLAKPRGGAKSAKSASASGDTRRWKRNVSITSGKSPSAGQRSGKASNKVGKSALASGDEHAAVLRRPAASLASDSPASASGTRVVTSICSHGVRIRCCAERRQELMDVIRARRSARSVWDPNDWRREIECIKIQKGTVYLGVGKHGGSRSKPLATGNTDLDTVTGKRKSTDRDSDDVLASGSKDRSIEQLASGNKDRGIEQLASGNKDRGIDQLAPGNKDRGIEQLASGKKDRGIDQLAPGSKDRGIEQLASGNKDRGSGRGVASESSAPGDTQHGVGTGREQPSDSGKVASSSESLATGSTGSIVMRYGLGYRLLGPATGRGSFGSVFPVIWKDGQDRDDLGELAVVKHVPIERPFVGPSVQEEREMEITSTLAHDNVVRLLRAIQTPFAVDLIFEQCSWDLLHALRASIELGSRPKILAQICSGLAYVHGEGIMHRDLKPANILLQSRPGGKFSAKIADFGLARRVPSRPPMHDAAPDADITPLQNGAGHWRHRPDLTTQVTTLWYRAPEVLLASRQYDTGVDMWAFGCIAVEVLTKSVAFPGSSESQMLVTIFSFAGTRKSDEWPSLLQLPQFRAFIQKTSLQPKKCQWPKLTAEAQTFVLETLKPCPSQRWSAHNALKHKFLLATGSDDVGGGDKGEEVSMNVG